MHTLSSLPHFASSTMAPLFEVYEVYDKNKHPYHNQLLEDIDSIPSEEMQFFKSSAPHFGSLMSDNCDKETQWQLYFLIVELNIQIGVLRKKLLLDTNPLPAPYKVNLQPAP